MNLNEYTFNNPNYLAKNKKYNNENYPYNNQFKYKNKFSSLLNTKKTFNDNINNNLNTEYFNNFYKKNSNELSEESANKKNNFSGRKNDIYAYSNSVNNRNFNNDKDVYSSNKKRCLSIILIAVSIT